MNISEVFDQVLERPQLYLGAASIIRLSAYMDGYRTALERADPKLDHSHFCGFYDWVGEHYRIETTHSWSDIIFFMAGHDEVVAIELTRELWAKYKQAAVDRESDV